MLWLGAVTAHAQGVVRGKVLDKTTEEPLSFVNVKVTRQETNDFVGGGMTDVEGNFRVAGLPQGSYMLQLSFVGYRSLERQFDVTSDHPDTHYARLYMSEDAQTLKEVTVTGQRSTMKLEVDRKSFDVSSLISNEGQAASDVLENIPSVEVDNDGNISLRGNSSVEVWINGKASGLTSDNRAQILQQLPAESIERIEVIDNPSAKFSAEGSAGIINIILKKDRKAGYYGSLQAGGTTRGGANTSFNINYNSSLFDAFFNIGYRHRANRGRTESEQEYLSTHTWQRYVGRSDNMGNNLFSRAGLTWHATQKDDLSLSGMMMKGGGHSYSSTPYRYGTIGTAQESRMMMRHTRSANDMHMFYGELNYRHQFADTHYIDFTIDANRWKMDNDNFYQDSTVYYQEERDVEYDYQYRPMFMNNRQWEVKLDYENQLSKVLKLQAGGQANFSHENTPQESYVDNEYWDGHHATEDKAYFNRFIYDMDVYALYLTVSTHFGRLGLMGGLRAEYWRVDTESYTWEQEHDASLRDKAFKKDYLEWFPSVFMSYQLTDNDQLQLNYTRRLRRPWGGELNSFRNTWDATMVSFGNPELTPEFSNSFSFNYLRTWTEHSLLLSAYYRPTTDVIQRINWQGTDDGIMYQTPKNVAKSQSSGVELTLKNKLFRILDLTTNGNAYYYKLNGFSYDMEGQTVTGEENHNFTWNARMTASLILPYDISVQASGNYRARQVITQGYRKSNYSVDLGVRKNFLNKTFTVSLNCRDLFNSRRFENFTSSDTFTRHQLNKRGGRTVSLNVTWNFGNMKQKRHPQQQDGQDFDAQQQYSGGEE